MADPAHATPTRVYLAVLVGAVVGGCLTYGAVRATDRPRTPKVVAVESDTTATRRLQEAYDALRAKVAQRTEELRGANKELRTQAERRRQALERLQKLNQLNELLLAPGGFQGKLETITDSLAELLDVDFCRLWLARPGDLCKRGCVHAQYTEGPHACHRRDRCLHLVASSGKHARKDSKMHNRVPFGVYKIGLVGEGKEKKFLTNDIAGDRRVPNPKWAAQLGFVAFAGYKLAVSEDKPLGVLALFANHPIPPEEDAMLENMASSIAAAVQTAQVQQAIRESEDKFRTLYEASSDAVFLLDKGQVVDCNAAAAGMFQAGGEDALKTVLFSELAADAWGASLSPAEALQTAVSDGSVRFEAKLRRISGHTFPADLCLTAMDLGSRKVVQAVVRDITERKEAEAERERLIEDLKEALANIKTLRGLLPICASCKKVRDDGGYWNQIEVYLHAHSEAEFSHSVCPECMAKLYPDAYARMQARKEKEDETN